MTLEARVNRPWSFRQNETLFWRGGFFCRYLSAFYCQGYSFFWKWAPRDIIMESCRAHDDDGVLFRGTTVCNGVIE